MRIGLLCLFLFAAGVRGQSLVAGSALLADSTGVLDVLPALVRLPLSEGEVELFLAEVDTVCLRLKQNPPELVGSWVQRLGQLRDLPLWQGLRLDAAAFLCLSFKLHFTQSRGQQPALDAALERQLLDLAALDARPGLTAEMRAALSEGRALCRALQTALAAVPAENAAVFAARRDELDAALVRLRAALP